jgi:putative ABC transport system permease protein
MTKERGNGGVPARRAVVVWAARMFRREWRQQLLVLALITVTVAAAILGASAAHNLAPSGDGEFGTADRRIELGSDDGTTFDADIAAIRRWTGTVDVIAHRTALVPGSVETVDVRAQALRGTFTGPLLALRAGRYPTAAGEVALTDGTAKLLGVGVGATVALDGRRRTVVGKVENPADLGDEFALVPPAHADAPRSVTLLARAGEEREPLDPALQERVRAMRRGNTEQSTAAVLALAVGAVVLLLIGLVASAGFVVVAQRRQRQLGMLAAVGATDRHLRLVVLANGVLVGIVSAASGAALALLAWLALAPHLEAGAGHRIATFDVPWWLVATGMVLAVVTATAAAWWPARAMARIPITEALSGRPPRPRPTHRSGAVAVVLLAVGFVCLSVGFDNPHDRANPVLVLTGMAAVVIGILFASPVAIRLLAVTARRLPVAPRLAVRDLARHQARSGAALAAISLGLGIAVALIVAAAAAAPSAGEGNLSDRQVLVRLGEGADEPVIPDTSPAELSRKRAGLDRYVATLDRPTVLALEAVVDPTVRETTGGKVVRPLASLARRVGPRTFRDVGRLYVATPEVLARLHIDPQRIRPDTDVLTAATGELRIVGGRPPSDVAPKVQAIEIPSYGSMPHALITPAGLDRLGWAPITAAWLIETGSPLTDVQLEAGRAMAAGAGLTIESRLGQDDLAAIRAGATAGGMLLALGVLAMTVGLIRSEATGDLRTLAATGATSATRRTLTAATAGGLGLLGAVLGIGGAYLALLGGYLDDLSALGRPPFLELAVIIVGVPLIAIAAGWLLAGREPATLTRVALD